MRLNRTMPILLLLASPTTFAEIHISPWLGYTLGGSVEDQDQNKLDLEGAASFALSVESDIDNGRIGLFYSQQNSEVEHTNLESSIHYLHLQSSVYYPVQEKISSYLGIGLGASYIDADWVKDEIGFSASIFAGFEYQMTDSVAVNTQLRWLGTVVDNDTTGICQFTNNSSDSCVIRFDTDWMNQFGANIGIVWKF
ncbi:outer membrane protein [Vibrio brasiliensis]|uniref:outer membrane protein n=1 Tax=Vibrio brasiliensis TaxID=170652 RepID=UPI001EFD4B7E|nr:porin family protein [Vibrio brasiliensis]MCG9725758.1 porin family protein [Vibrio brasiliensis]